MAIWDIVVKVVVGVLGAALTALILRIYKDVRTLVKREPTKYTHIRYEQNRATFNDLGIQILNGAIANDTVYTILRSGTFIGDFSDAIKKFRVETIGTKLVVIVPDKDVFIANYGKNLKSWITDVFENPECAGVRALVLEPGKSQPSEARMSGYLFISDGHDHKEDDGFYANSVYSKKFLLGYMKSLVKSGERFQIPD